jgi:Cof subfamily protein (haloacid dehalogenase superfamily)
MAIKAILLDIDGTLTNSKKEITPETKKALMIAQQYGLKLVIASGRPSRGIFKYGDQLDMRTYHGMFVCYNGARVVDCTTGEVYVDVTIPASLTKEVLTHMKKFDVRTIITHGSHMVVEDVYNCMIHDGDREFNVIEYESRMNGYGLMETEDLVKFTDFPVNKILTAGDSDYLQAHYKEMAAPFEGRLSMMFTANFYYEFTALGIDKGKALETAMAKIGILPEECIAFGDAENDISMLKYAGIGVAMGNAQPKVKEMADAITDDNDHDGIAKALYRYVDEMAFGIPEMM